MKGKYALLNLYAKEVSNGPVWLNLDIHQKGASGGSRIVHEALET